MVIIFSSRRPSPVLQHFLSTGQEVRGAAKERVGLALRPCLLLMIIFCSWLVISKWLPPDFEVGSSWSISPQTVLKHLKRCRTWHARPFTPGFRPLAEEEKGKIMRQRNSRRQKMPTPPPPPPPQPPVRAAATLTRQTLHNEILGLPALWEGCSQRVQSSLDFRPRCNTSFTNRYMSGFALFCRSRVFAAGLLFRLPSCSNTSGAGLNHHEFIYNLCIVALYLSAVLPLCYERMVCAFVQKREIICSRVIAKNREEVYTVLLQERQSLRNTCRVRWPTPHAAG